MSMFEIKDGKIIYPPEVEEKLKLMEKARLKQWNFVKIADIRIKIWAAIHLVKIYRTEYVPCFGESLDVFIFYKTDKALKKYKENGMIQKTQRKFMDILKKIGYIKKFNDVVRFEFDSHENVMKNYEGNYYYRIL